MSDASLPAISTQALSVCIGSRELVSDLSIEIYPGELVAILGRNGSGKTLTLHTLAGLRQARQGVVRLGCDPITQLNRRAIAQRLGVLLQDLEEGFPTTVLEAVLIGRHPHLPLWEWESADDERIAQRALAQVDLEGFANRQTDTLSGGEQRRMAIATLLAQDPQIFLLDEPTNHLDPHHQLGMLSLFRSLAHEGRTVIATLHDPTLAARFADRVLLLLGDGRWRIGPTAEVLTASSLSELYLTPIIETTAQGRRVFVTA